MVFTFLLLTIPDWELSNTCYLFQMSSFTIDLGVGYDIDGSQTIDGYADAGHASHWSRYSVFCNIFIIGGVALFWKNEFEERYSLSTAESEIRVVYGFRENQLKLVQKTRMLSLVLN